MTTQYSPILKLALPVQGELSGTWGDVVNDNITSMVEQAIAGRAVINTWSTNSHTLTSANGTTSESRCAMLELTDTGTSLSAAGTVICPALSKIYIVKNAAGQNITVKTASGTGILVPDGRTTFLFCDGTNVVEAMTHTTSLQLGTSTTVTAVLDEDNMASNSATSLATQQSIKAYVDAQVGAFDSLAEVLAVGNTTGGTDLLVSTGDDITFADSSKAIFGASGDLEVFHDGSNSHIRDSGTGGLIIKGEDSVQIRTTTSNAAMLYLAQGGAVTAYHNGSPKLATTSAGIAVTGNATFADNGKAIFGAGSDLQIYHDGSHSYIQESGTGNLFVRASNLVLADVDGTQFLRGTANSDVKLYHNNDQKLATTSTGIDVTGTATMDGLTVDGNIIQSGGDEIQNSGTLRLNGDYDASGAGNIDLKTKGILRQSVGNNGDISFYEDTGTTAKLFWDASAESLGIGTTTFPSSNTRIAIQGTQGASGSDTNVAADDFFIDNDGNTGMTLGSANDGVGYYAFADADVSLRGGIFYDHSTDDMGFRVASATRMTIDSSGRVGIGTDSADEALEVNGDLKISGSGFGIVQFGETSDQTKIIGRDNSHASLSNTMDFFTNSENRMSIDASGNVGIGTDSPSADLHINGTSTDIRITNSTNTSGFDIGLLGGDSNDDGYVFNRNAGSRLIFGTANTEAMRIDDAGNLLVGTTNTSPATNNVDGIALRSAGHINVSRSSGVVGYFNRKTDDGQILDLRKDGTNVGSVVSRAGVVSSIVLDPRSGGSSLTAGQVGGTQPFIASGNNSGSSEADATVNLGKSTARFKDLYLSGGVYLGGTGAANKLDDYERGTWQVKFFNGATEVSPYRENAEYLKMGDWVWVQGTIEFRTNYPSTSTSQASIKNLPFTISNDLVAFQHGTVKMYNSGTVTTSMFVTPSSFSGTTTLLFHTQGKNSASSWIGGVGCSSISTSVNTAITFNFQYRV